MLSRTLSRDWRPTLLNCINPLLQARAMAYSKREPRHAEILEYWTGHTAQKPLGPVAYNGAFVQKWFQGGTAVDAVGARLCMQAY
eukprot:1056082-Pelagomonas_calceolata.AAC.1